LNGAIRLALVKGFMPIGWFPLVNEYPKSGGSWMAQMLSESLELPFPRNRLPMARSSILHGHYRHASVSQPTVIVWRDGRDVLVSLYFHRLYGNTLTSTRETNIAKQALGIDDPADVERYLPRFIELVANESTHPRYSWETFVKEWHKSPKAVCEILYEDMLNEPAGCLMMATEALGKSITLDKAREITARYSFKRQSGRMAGEENKTSYLRKGVAGDWKAKFSREARQVFDHHMGDALITLGYETNRNWVERDIA